MAQDHGRTDRARLLSARLSGIALRHARWGALTAAEKASGAAELREVAGDRGDLLAGVAGLALGSAKSKGPKFGARAQAVAELCRMAGADEANAGERKRIFGSALVKLLDEAEEPSFSLNVQSQNNLI